jgi:hypothetical protein
MSPLQPGNLFGQTGLSAGYGSVASEKAQPRLTLHRDRRVPGGVLPGGTVCGTALISLSLASA